jgi:four helix bundle protein
MLAGGRIRLPSGMSDFKKLKVWQYSHLLAVETYKTVVKIKGAHHTSIRSQIVRASGSIPANIAEGRGKPSDQDFARFIGYAIGSAAELEAHLIFARDVELIPLGQATALLSQLTIVRKMLLKLRNKLL